MTHEAGKGDKTRPTNWDHFSENFDRIFGKKPMMNQEVFEDAKLSFDEVVEDEDYEDEICSGCSGSGEGMWDGATCTKCHGSGVEPCDKEDDI